MRPSSKQRIFYKFLGTSSFNRNNRKLHLKWHGERACVTVKSIKDCTDSGSEATGSMQTEADVMDKKEELAQALFDHIPVGVGSQGIIATNAKDLDAILEMGMDYSLREVPHAFLAQKYEGILGRF